MDIIASLDAAIRERIDGSAVRPFAVLDFDNTCITNDVAEITLAFLCRDRMLRCADLLPTKVQDNDEYHRQVFRRYHAMLAQGDIVGASRLCAGIFAGFTPGEAESIVLEAMAYEDKRSGTDDLYGVPIKTGIAVRGVVRTLIDRLIQHDVQVWIVSASPDIAVRTAMKRLAIPGNVIALQNILENGVLSKDLEEPQSILHGKVDCIRTFIDTHNRPVLGVGDSMYDIPMLEYANVCAVVAGNPALIGTARERGWFILEDAD